MAQVYEKILVAVDGSEISDLAFERALKIADATGSELILFSAFDNYVLGDSQFDATRVAEVLREQTQEFVEEYVAQAEEAGADVHAVVIQGDPRVEIPQYAADNGVGLVIMGATGKGAIERALVGSVSEYVMRHASCDVLLVR